MNKGNAITEDKTAGSSRRRSMRGELSRLLVLILVADLVAIGLITLFCLGPFYKRDKIRKMKETYTAISETMEDTGGVVDELMEMSVQDNIMIFLANSDLTDSQSTKRDGNRNRTRLFGYISGFYNDKITILQKTDKYILQEANDTKINTSYLEMWGQLENGYYFLLQTPLEGMTGAVRLTMLFYLIVGSIAVLAAVVAVYFIMKRYTRPIVELTEISKKMADLDFDEKYEGDLENEIGELGESFNKMSMELENSINGLRHANEELQKDNERKTQIDEARKEFLNNVSHELKTPLALVQGYAEGLRDGVANDPESRGLYLDVIIDESEKMNSLVKKLLTLNELEFGNEPLATESFDLRELILGVVSGMKIMIDEAGAEVSVEEGGPCLVRGDSFKTEEIITNYLSNACHHAAGEKKIDIKLIGGSGNVRVEVFNTGEHIPEADLPHIFERFYKVDKARTRDYGGSGIGLSIVKAICDSQGGECGASNTDGGVVFYFTIPAD